MAVDSSVIKGIGHPVSAALVGFLTWLTASSNSIGTSLTAAISITGGIAGLTFSILFQRYMTILGAGGPPANAARKAYDDLRNSLASGGSAGEIYYGWLRKILGLVDRFFGDHGPRSMDAAQLGDRYPLWTSTAFDRCLLIALVYPIFFVLVTWIIFGQVGPAEQGLLLKSGVAGWQRIIFAVWLSITAFAVWQAITVQRWRRIGWLVVAFSLPYADYQISTLLEDGVHVVPVLIVMFSVGAVASGLSGAVAVSASVAGTIVYALAFGNFWFSLFIGLSNSLPTRLSENSAVSQFILALSFIIIFGSAIAISIAVAAIVSRAQQIAVKFHKRGLFAVAFLFTMILLCFATAPHSAEFARAPLLFIGLLTLVNAPFDWVSLGLTRALLRRGLELKGWWPLFFALLDTILAAFVVACLVVTMVLAIQVLDYLAPTREEHGPDTLFLPLDTLIDGLFQHPTDPIYWWIYSLLLSTTIPSLLNLIIGGASFVRGIPGFSYFLSTKMPAGRPVPNYNRTWIALVLALQVVVGGLVGLAAQLILIIGVLGYAMPWFGLGLLDMTRRPIP